MNGSWFWSGFCLNLLKNRFIWGLGLILSVVGIRVRSCLFFGIALLVLAPLVSLIEQLQLKKHLENSDDPETDRIRDMLNAPNWRNNIMDLVKERMEGPPDAENPADEEDGFRCGEKDKTAKKAVIGIVAKHAKDEKARTDSLIRDEMKQAVFDNGAIAVGILSPNEKILYTDNDWKSLEDKIDKDAVIGQIGLCDGIILQGGSTNEAFENWIAKYCYDNDIPCLGICAGQTSIVLGLGGALFRIPNPEKHYRPDEDYVHDIRIDVSSRFYGIVGKEKIPVNSRHKLSVSDCPGLDKVGFCEDGYADVVESKDKSFYIGVRFHPESLYKTDESMNAIFKSFITACEKKRGS
ncbi:MAG: gamma-glutamyl-gamma-aminobutyrate hydrolase family protein [Clostridia bacterium]|nr:gamma-glutamyl-gamma-aminobutyrate hydrolase family protein [Clostridia bacterium]